MTTNHQRLEFMQQLASACRGDHGLCLTGWERRFMQSFHQAERQTLWFIGERPRWADALWRKYGGEIGHPFPLESSSSSSSPSRLAAAAADGCEFFVKDESRKLVRCNAPAAFVNRSGFRYCKEHAEQVQADLKRRGGAMALEKFQPQIKL